MENLETQENANSANQRQTEISLREEQYVFFLNNISKAVFLVPRNSASVLCLIKSNTKGNKNAHRMDKHYLSIECFECLL